MALPLYCFVRGDTLGILVLASESERVATLIERIARAAAPRVARTGRLRIRHRGRLLPEEVTLAAAGVAALDRIDAFVEAAHG
jgi:hypothetical protein